MSEIVSPALWSRDLHAAVCQQPPWLWQGFLAPGSVTLLTSQWKSGKTTLVSLLLSRLKTGGAFAGQPLAAGKAVVISEESATHWDRRHQQLDFGEAVCFVCRPFRGKPTPEEWQALLDQVAELHDRFGLSLAVIDTLATFFPGRDEAGAASMLNTLLPLNRLTERGLAVLVLHHPRKGDPSPGQAARGSGALPAFVDILVEMAWPNHAPTDRRRRLRTFSRFEATPRELVIELNADGTDYLAVGDFAAAEFRNAWATVRKLLEAADAKRARFELLADWPDPPTRPCDTTLYHWLERAVAEGVARRDGTGHKRSPFRYWLPESEARWRSDPVRRVDLEIDELMREAGAFGS